MSDATASPWVPAWEAAHKQATGSPTTLAQGHDIHLAGGVPARLEFRPGQISGVVTPPYGEPARATIRVAPLSGEEQRALAAVLTDSSHRDALRQGRLPAALADPARTADVPIAPGAAHLAFACACGQAPCRHTAALGHAVARHVHARPALLMTLRGLHRWDLTGLPHQGPADLPHQSPTGSLHQSPTGSRQAPDPAAAAPGKHRGPRTPGRPAGPYVGAHHAYQQWAGGTPTVPGREAGDGGGRPTVTFAGLELPEPPAPAPSLKVLRHLAAEAARQSRQLLTEGTVLETDPVADAVRLAASLPAGERPED
ncbi:hypothetical protein ACWF94_26835, partial [Streptomyces sp. NPDC055078]